MRTRSVRWIVVLAAALVTGSCDFGGGRGAVGDDVARQAVSEIGADSFGVEADGYVLTTQPSDESYDVYTAASATYSLAMLGDDASYDEALDSLIERLEERGVDELVESSNVPPTFVVLETARAFVGRPEARDPFRADMIEILRTQMAGADLDDPNGPYDSSTVVYTVADRLLSSPDVGLAEELDVWLAGHPVACERSETYPAAVRVTGFAERNALDECPADMREIAETEISAVLTDIGRAGLNAGTCTAIYQAAFVLDEATSIAGRNPTGWVQWAATEFGRNGSDVDICGPSIAGAAEQLGIRVQAEPGLVSDLTMIAALGASIRVTLLDDSDVLAAALLLGDRAATIIPEAPDALRTRSLEALTVSWARTGRPPTVRELDAVPTDGAFGLVGFGRLLAAEDGPPCDLVTWFDGKLGDQPSGAPLQATAALARAGEACGIEIDTDAVGSAATSVLDSSNEASSSLAATWDAAASMCLLGQRPEFPSEVIDLIGSMVSEDEGIDLATSGELQRVLQLSELHDITEEDC